MVVALLALYYTDAAPLLLIAIAQRARSAARRGREMLIEEERGADLDVGVMEFSALTSGMEVSMESLSSTAIETFNGVIKKTKRNERESANVILSDSSFHVALILFHGRRVKIKWEWRRREKKEIWRKIKRN